MHGSKTESPNSFFYYLVYLAWSLPALAALTAPLYIQAHGRWEGVPQYSFRAELALEIQWIEWSLLGAGILGLLIAGAILTRRRVSFPGSKLIWSRIAPTLFWAYATYFLILFPYGPLVILAGLTVFCVMRRRKLSSSDSDRVTLALAILGLLPLALFWIVRIT